MSYKARIGVLLLLSLLSIIVLFMSPAIPQSPGYHDFADQHTVLGIPNFSNVFSNIFFLFIGIYGFISLKKESSNRGIRLIYMIMFTGIFLVGLGSGYYHYNPTNITLVYDRLPMTLVFMSLLSATIAEHINKKAGTALLFPLVAIGIFSVLWWYYTESRGNGDLRLYGLVQFYPVVFLPLIMILFPAPAYSRGLKQLIWVILWYIVAKLLETFDGQIFNATGGKISGHALKHIAAAASTWYLVKMYQYKYVNNTNTTK